ncbi:RNA-binding protein [archaeon]|nr:RNA-binding protein [archaeon]
MKRYFARKDLLASIKGDLANISKEFADILPENVEVVEMKGNKYVIGESGVLVFGSQKGFFPTVKGALLIEDKEKRTVVVDKGAISFVINGADIMRPGVVKWDVGIKKGDYVIIREETHSKAIGIGEALWDGSEFEGKATGKCVKSLYFVGDDVWKMG